jgi:hypothetical protein
VFVLSLRDVYAPLLMLTLHCMLHLLLLLLAFPSQGDPADVPVHLPA